MDSHIEHADRHVGVLPGREHVGESATGLNGRKTVRNDGYRLSDRPVRLPLQVPRDPGILRVGRKEKRGIGFPRQPSHEPRRCKRAGEGLRHHPCFCSTTCVPSFSRAAARFARRAFNGSSHSATLE